MRELIEALIKEAKKTEAARQAAAEQKREQELNAIWYRAGQALKEQARVEQDKQRQREATRAIEEEKKRKQEEAEHDSQLRVEAKKLMDDYSVKKKNAINDVDSRFLSISRQMTPDLEAGLVAFWRLQGWKVNSLADIYKASKAAVVEKIRRELAEVAKGNPYVWPNFI